MSLQDDYFELIRSENLLSDQKIAIKRIWDAFCDMENQQDELLDIQRAFKNIVRLCFKLELDSLTNEFTSHATQIEKLTKQLLKLEFDMNIEKSKKGKKTKKSAKRKK